MSVNLLFRSRFNPVSSVSQISAYDRRSANPVTVRARLGLIQGLLLLLRRATKRAFMSVAADLAFSSSALSRVISA